MTDGQRPKRRKSGGWLARLSPTGRPGRRGGARHAGGLAAAALFAALTVPVAAADIPLPGEAAYPENLDVGPDGTLYVSGFVTGGIVRIPPGASTGEMWIAPGAYGTRSTFGVLVDAPSNTLWVCSNDLSGLGIPGPGEAKGSALKGFDLKTGAGKVSATFPVSPSICNDIAIGPDGAAYVTNTLGDQILRLKPGATDLEVWKTDPLFKPQPKEAGLDGIAFGTDGNLYLTTFTRAKLLRVAVKDGQPGEVTELKPSRPLVFADAIRPLGDGAFLLAEGGGRVDRMTVSGDTATIDVLRDGIDGGVTGVALHGKTVFASVGQLSVVLDPARKGTRPDLPFRILAVPLTTP